MKNLYKKETHWYVRKIHQGKLYHTSFSFKTCGGVRNAQKAAEKFLRSLNNLLSNSRKPVRNSFISALKRKAIYGPAETDNKSNPIYCPHCTRRLPDRSEEVGVSEESPEQTGEDAEK